MEGVGFKRYIELFEVLDIPWFVRTDNDYVKNTRKKKTPKEVYRLAGIQRGIDISLLRKDLNPSLSIEKLEKVIQESEGQIKELLEPKESHRSEMYSKFYKELRNNNIFLAKIGLEEDLLSSSEEINQEIRKYFNQLDDEYDNEDVLQSMQKNKSTFMFHFVQNHLDSLSNITDELAEPLHQCKKIIEELRHV
ncbi:hypothetical protein JCM19055_2596 [Geomicrobium sp. JCM 19055]|nr:hypothetical protein [Geomicrobium sp. JCM 19055]GAJ99587.1 hypothetical protein JCM19055_2596 [Geomicrobium sp. JCM 19055]